MDRLADLRAWLVRADRVAIGYSGGVDSTFLLAVALEALGPEGVLPVTLAFQAVPSRELEAARTFLAQSGARALWLEEDASRIPGFDTNPPDRCYLCKRHLFARVREESRRRGFPCVVDGTHAEDLLEDRPGLRALRELGVASPLAELGFTKQEIREASRRLGIPGWDRPALACLATRFPSGQAITAEQLHRVDEAEEALRAFGFPQVRVRSHGDLARIETAPEALPRLADPVLREAVVAALHGLGFRHVALDLGGYRLGSMNG